jgi:hypothetical protein
MKKFIPRRVSIVDVEYGRLKEKLETAAES